MRNRCKARWTSRHLDRRRYRRFPPVSAARRRGPGGAVRARWRGRPGRAMNIRESVIVALRDAADPVRAPQQQAYMKSDMPYLGVGVPQCRRIASAVFARHPLPDAGAWEAAILDLWRRAAHREERYAAVELLLFRRYSSWLEPARLPMIEEMVVTGAVPAVPMSKAPLSGIRKADTPPCIRHAPARTPGRRSPPGAEGGEIRHADPIPSRALPSGTIHERRRWERQEGPACETQFRRQCRFRGARRP